MEGVAKTGLNQIGRTSPKLYSPHKAFPCLGLPQNRNKEGTRIGEVAQSQQEKTPQPENPSPSMRMEVPHLHPYASSKQAFSSATCSGAPDISHCNSRFSSMNKEMVNKRLVNSRGSVNPNTGEKSHSWPL
ncbi:hypothetical protein KSP39_PZI004920 [Platanthera zijinensis]|uniref:Uncharacterized protein n=1 Tax=Platanthera zijinensis TaxID=2320716 RepID=A0AAP0GC73_9ASPA